MSRKVILFIAQSLDGYISTKDNKLDWLFKVEGLLDNGYTPFYENIDTIMMGRKTYDWLIDNIEEAFPYKGKETFVFTTKNLKDTNDVKFINTDVKAFVDIQKKLSKKDIFLVGGGKLIDIFMKNNLIDEIIITIAPVILGSGIPLYYEGIESKELTLIDVIRYNQFVTMKYIFNK